MSEVAVEPGGTFTFTARVSGTSPGQPAPVSWSVEEGPKGGTIDAGGKYTAPSTEGTYHVSASRSGASARASAAVTVRALKALGPDRRTVWRPGVSGGIPVRSTVCKTVAASAYGDGAKDATAAIQAAIDTCSAGQVVLLSAGTFTINRGHFILINKGITLRGAGPGRTTLQKTDGAKPGQEATGPEPSPLVIIGPVRYDKGEPHPDPLTADLTADAVKGSSSVAVGSSAGFKVGQFVVLDELSGAVWQKDPAGRGQIWASPDLRVVWQRHQPPQTVTDDPFPEALSWFSREDRPTSEVKRIAQLRGNTVVFDTPIHISYRTSRTAQVASFVHPFVEHAGIEDLKVIGGDQGNIRFQWAANCWAKRVESTVWHDEGVAIDASFRVEVRESYVHDAAWAQPGGAGYAISLSNGSSESLVENSIIVKANKVMVARSAGAGSVFGYNYVDDGYINTNDTWIEVGLNASHMVGSHHVLFEGNESFNWDSDKTHGNAIYHTVFRNYLRAFRRSFDDASNRHGPHRAAGAAYYSYWHSFIGNVLGTPGRMTGWAYESGALTTAAIFKLGWDDWPPYPVDARVAATSVRHGNYDYLTSSVKWDPGFPERTLPTSLYLTQKPAFFAGYTWPWVDPTGPKQLFELPAKVRFEAGTPFGPP
ncbi:MAG TPA: glycosyl hydrolase family 28-related protein [Myxococcaceae bacterium]|nr:glycosyl hydrolase family 28-related protein [Myxococcaceae bacterium]